MKKAYDLSVWNPVKIRDSLQFFRDSFGRYPDSLLMSASDYADVRKWGRDAIDIGSDLTAARSGLTATFCGVSLVVKREYTKGVVLLRSGDGVLAHVTNPGRWLGHFRADYDVYFHLGTYESCVDACLALQVMES